MVCDLEGVLAFCMAPGRAGGAPVGVVSRFMVMMGVVVVWGQVRHAMSDCSLVGSWTPHNF